MPRLGDANTGHRESSVYADGTIKINFILICSNKIRTITSTREVRHSLTWHSSKSESALKRFEPVAVTKLQQGG